MALGRSQHMFCWDGVKPGMSRQTRQETLSELAASVSTPESSAATTSCKMTNHTVLLGVWRRGMGEREGRSRKGGRGRGGEKREFNRYDCAWNMKQAHKNSAADGFAS